MKDAAKQGEETQTNNDVFDGVRNFIKAKLVEMVVPSVAVAVAQNGRIIWEEGFGWADRENRIPADEHTMYSLASISKPITATGLMILKERGLLDLDRPINDYLGEAKLKAWVGSSDDATVRRVANHSSGLPTHYQFFYEDTPHRPPSRDETILRYGNLIMFPGERYMYSNLGYGILDYVISRLSGKGYSDFMRQEVFLPLGMTHTSVHIGPRLEKYQAIRYGGDGLPIPFYDFDHPGASAIFSSAHDLVRFGMFHLKAHLPNQKPILSDETIDEMQQPTNKLPPFREGEGYGIGWRISNDNMGYHTINHSGGMPGVSTRLTLIPSEKIAVVVLSNTGTALPELVFHEILSALLPEYAKNRARFEAEKKKEEEKTQELQPSFKPPSELIGTWSGSVHTYKEDIPLTLWINEYGDVHTQLDDQLKTLLNGVSFRDGFLRGLMTGDIGTEDTNRLPYHLDLELKLRGKTLNRTIHAVSKDFTLGYWVELNKQEME